jgi:hypothetical protein
VRGAFYKALGFLVWKGFVADVRRRTRIAVRRVGIGMLLMVVVSGAIVLAQRRAGDGR